MTWAPRLLVTVVVGLSLASGAGGPRPALAEPASGPQRIVSLSPAITETLFALGAGPQVVGVTRYCDYPPEAQRLPRVGGYLDPNPEAVLQLRPDLVVAAPSPGNRRAVVALRRLDLPVLVVADRSLDDLLASLRVLGDRLGLKARAAALATDLSAGLRRIKARGAARRPLRALLVYGHRPLVVAGPGSYGGELLQLLGLHNVAAGTRPYPVFSMERVLLAGPEVIFDAAMDAEVDPRRFWRQWPEIPAVSAGRVVAVSDQVLRPGPRIVAALEELAAGLDAAASASAPGPTVPRRSPGPGSSQSPP